MYHGNYKTLLYLYIIAFFLVPSAVFAQDNSKNIVVITGDNKDGSPYFFKSEKPDLAQSWSITISEFTGRILFQDTGDVWNENGYMWIPTDDIHLYPAIYYIVSISFIDANRDIMRTDATKFFIPNYITDMNAPTVFFEGNTAQPNNNIYRDDSIEQLMTYVKNKAQSEYQDYRILFRGHATFTTISKEERKTEQLQLLELSRKRALVVLDRLVAEGVDSTRMYYESLGGSAEISQENNQRWKNRRVEIIFVNDSDATAFTEAYSQNLTTVKQIDSPASTTQAEHAIVETDPPLHTLPRIDQYVEPWPDIPILGSGQMQAKYMLAFILYYTPTTDEVYINYLKRIIMLYINEAAREGVNHDVAFAQMLLETDYLRFMGQVRREQYNFSGIGAVDSDSNGYWFSTEVIGIRAHIQHLKGYATTNPLQGIMVDPRYPVLAQMKLLGSSLS